MCICCCTTKRTVGISSLVLGIILFIFNFIPLTIFSTKTVEYKNVLYIINTYGYGRNLFDDYINNNIINNYINNNNIINKTNLNKTLRNLLRSDGKIRYTKTYKNFKNSEKGLEIFKFIFSFIWLAVSILIFFLFTKFQRIEPTDQKAIKTKFILIIYWILVGINIIIIFALIIIRTNALECYKDILDIEEIKEYDNFENRNYYGMYLDIISIILLMNCVILSFRAFQYLKNPDLIVGRKIISNQTVYYQNKAYIQTLQNGQIILVPADPSLIQPIQGPVPISYNNQQILNNNYPLYINVPINQDGSVPPQFIYNNQLYTINPSQQQINQGGLQINENNNNNNNNNGNNDLIGNNSAEIQEKYA
jgi:hypothetical protein